MFLVIFLGYVRPVLFSWLERLAALQNAKAPAQPLDQGCRLWASCFVAVENLGCKSAKADKSNPARRALAAISTTQIETPRHMSPGRYRCCFVAHALALTFRRIFFFPPKSRALQSNGVPCHRGANCRIWITLAIRPSPHLTILF